MLRWVIIFLVLSMISAILGFSHLAVASAGIAKVLFMVFVILFLISFLMHIFRRSP